VKEENHTMIKKTIVEALNKQIQHELNNAHLYEGTALYFEQLNLHGLGAWMHKQAGEERGHAERFIKHLLDRGGKIELGPLPAAATECAGPLEAARGVLALEQSTTALIYKLADLARKEGDYALEVALHWFITEQVEEEQWSGELAAQMELFHKSPGQLYMLDHQWGKRVKGS
jgi:ferritin